MRFAIEQLGLLFGCQRVHVIYHDPAKDCLQMAEEWCAVGIAPGYQLFKEYRWPPILGSGPICRIVKAFW
ncbi:hypothetical protein NON20_08375 [Synechocystis sp. B12]|nr:hypothetical protein NON20_08375 [Synechocystis sp. B12]